MHTALTDEQFIEYISELSDEQLEAMYDREFDEMSDMEQCAISAEIGHRGLDPQQEAFDDYQREELSRI